MLGPLLALALAAASPLQPDTLTDAGLVKFASQFPHGNGVPQMVQIPGNLLGIHHHTRVLAEYHCSDICPAYTHLIIHYDAPPGPQCAKIGGREVQAAVPVSIAMSIQTFCVPAALIPGRLYTSP